MIILTKVSKEYTRMIQNSVDTAAYLLSNMNISKKAETITIVDGTKDTHSVGCKTTDTIITNGTSDLLNNNSNAYRQCIPVVHIRKSVENHTKSVHQSPNMKKVYTVPDDDIAFNAPPVCKTEIVENETGVGKDSARYNPDISVFKQFVVKTSKNVFSNANTIPWMESNAKMDEINKGMDTDSNNLDMLFAEGDSTVFESDRILFNRKKLYSGRDSPVDLIRMRRSSIYRINKPKKSFHPAFDPSGSATPTLLRKWSLLRRRKRTEKKRKKWSELISKKLARINSSSQEFQDDSQTLSSISDPKEIVRRSERLKDVNGKESVLSECKKLSDFDNNEVGKENLVSSSNGPANSKKLESTEDAKAVKNNPTNSSKGETLEKHVEKDTPIEIKYAVVRLERISLPEIQKHMSDGSTYAETVNSPLQNIALPYECKNAASQECHSVNKSSPLLNNNTQDILYNMANNSSYHSSSDKSQKVKNFEMWKQNRSSYVMAQMKTPEQEPANGLRKGTSRNSFKEKGKNGLSKEEILEKIMWLKAVVVLERLPQEKLRNIRIRRCTRNFFNQMKKSETKDSSIQKHVSINTNTPQFTNSILKTDSKKASQRFVRKRTTNQIKRAVPSVSELRRTEGRNWHRTITLVSSDEEAEFVRLLQNLRSPKKQRTESEIKRSNVTVAGIVDTSDEESDLLVNDDNLKSPSKEVGSTVRQTKRSTLQRKVSRSVIDLRKKALEQSRTLRKCTSNSIEVSGSIFTSTRLNRKAISSIAIRTRATTSSPFIIGTRISTTVRTSKRNNASPDLPVRLQRNLSTVKR